MKWTGHVVVARLAVLSAVCAPVLDAAAYDAAFVHAVEPEVGRTLADLLEERVTEALDGPRSPRLMPADVASERLERGRDPREMVEAAEETVSMVRGRLRSGQATRDLTDRLDAAREDLLRSLVTRPRLELLRDSWALRGLAVHMLGEPEAARRDYARVLESDPSFRPDPRLFPPEARQQMGEALMARTDSHWRILSSGDVAAIGRWLGVDYVVLAHLGDTGLVELSWRVDVFDVVAGRFVGETEVHFPDAAGERERAALEVAELISEVVPRMARRATPEPPPEPPRRERAAAPMADGRDIAAAPSPARSRPPIADGPFEPRIEETTDEDRGSGRGWLVAAAVVAVAAGGTAAYFGLSADRGSADLQIVFH